MTSACPICGRAVRETQNKPFCTARCKEVDLHRWLSESYRIPANPDPDDEADEGEEHPVRPSN
jgi:endogenous inhibitor of DNA gyrase (YacG/DUF329 family)